MASNGSHFDIAGIHGLIYCILSISAHSAAFYLLFSAGINAEYSSVPFQKCPQIRPGLVAVQDIAGGAALAVLA